MPDSDKGADGLEKIFREFGKPGDPDFHNNMGNVHLGKGDYAAAEAEFRTALKLRPDDVMFRCNLGSALSGKGDPEAAMREYELCLRLCPTDWHTLFNLANLHFRTGRVAEAAPRYQEALRQDPERAAARYRLAMCLTRLDRWPEAVPLFEEALRREPDSPHAADAMTSLGAFFLDQGDLKKAEALLAEAVKLKPGDFMARFCLARVYHDAAAGGDPRGNLLSLALSHAEKAIALDPEDEDAQAVLKAVRAALGKS